MTYQPQLNDLRYTLKDIAGFDKLVSEGMFPELDQELVDAVLEEAGKFAAEIIAPIKSCIGPSPAVPFHAIRLPSNP